MLPKRRKRRAVAKLFKFALASVICLVLLAGAVLAGGYFLLQGENAKGTAVLESIEAGIQNVVGDQFQVQLQGANLSFNREAKVVFKSNDVQITRKSDDKLLSLIGTVEARLNLLQLLGGKATVEVVRMENAVLYANTLGTGRGILLPTHFDKPFNAIGNTLSAFQTALNENNFEKFEILNSEIHGHVMGRKKDDPIRLEQLSVTPSGQESFSLLASLKTEISNIEISSAYTSSPEDGSAYNFDVTGVRMREWLSDPVNETGVMGSNAIIALEGSIPFDANNQAMDPTLKIRSGQSDLRLGRDTLSEVGSVDLNLRIILAKNQIELDPSRIQVGRLDAIWNGGIKPYNASRGYGGSLRYDLIMQKGVFAPTRQDEPVVPAAFKVAGLYNVDDKDLLIDKILLKTEKGEVSGKGRMLFGGETPSLKAEGETQGISIHAVKQFWPFFMASGARDWFHKQFIDGWVENGILSADIPPGKLFRIRDGVNITPEEFNLQLNLKDASFLPFGELPAIENGNGTLEISGMAVSANILSGKASADGGDPITIKSGKFKMADYSAQPKFAETKLSLEGNATSIAKIADRKPLRVMERMKVVPEQFKGKGYADIVARFPIAPDTQYSQVDWNVLLDLQNASSSRALAGRKFSNADIVIDASPTAAKVIGKASIDGVPARLNLIEPIGKSGKVKRKREITSRMSEKDRKAFGIDLAPVISGPVDITIVQSAGDEKYTINMTDASISLPWVGWSKGKGIPAKAAFDLKTENGVFRLNNFVLSGKGFESSGDLVLTRKGLVSANLKKVKLNEGDSLALAITRDKDVYNINVVGSSYDARAILNTLLYQASFNEAEGKRSVNLTANVNRITGFGKRTMRDVNLVYRSRNGILTSLDMKAGGSNNAFYNVKAQRESGSTRFTISSNNAGNALAFANIYTRMEGGQVSANLVRNANGPFVGPVTLENFTVVNEPRLARLSSNVKTQVRNDRNVASQIIPEESEKRMTFQLAQALIDKGDGYLKVRDAVIRNTIIGLSMEGLVYNDKDYMSLVGTFMPANGVNLALASIPLLGRFFANGRDRALIGITYKLEGARTSPELLVNPLSIVTPGFFNKVFEFK